MFAAKLNQPLFDHGNIISSDAKIELLQQVCALFSSHSHATWSHAQRAGNSTMQSIWSVWCSLESLADRTRTHQHRFTVFVCVWIASPPRPALMNVERCTNTLTLCVSLSLSLPRCSIPDLLFRFRPTHQTPPYSCHALFPPSLSCSRVRCCRHMSMQQVDFTFIRSL